ncbi:hypothetical protein RhiirC2_780480 [Rhizophagus irregularis]|uniref:Uncharacterized protein n=1 Tax=Rhizophagus irregularis TaxID=588596 RepID=A0A2N1N7S1_9GLOM|nr:hypothetical protein RhiirC2_780480 [Rhizophagus irregularis]
MTRKRSILSVLKDDSRPIAKPIKSSTRIKVNCFCNKCEEKLVNPCTQRKHASSSSQMSIKKDIKEEENQETDNSDFNYLPQKYISRYTKLLTTFTELFINDFEQSEATESNTSIDDNDNLANNEYSEIFENYLCLPFEPSINTKMVNDNRILWILIWIMRFQIKFINLSETETESLIKFMKLVLREIRDSIF